MVYIVIPISPQNFLGLHLCMGIKCKPKKSNSDQWISTKSSLHLKKLPSGRREFPHSQWKRASLSQATFHDVKPSNSGLGMNTAKATRQLPTRDKCGQKIATCWWIMLYLGIRNHSNAFMKGTPSGPAFHNLLSKMLDIETSSWAEPWGYPLCPALDHHGSLWINLQSRLQWSKSLGFIICGGSKNRTARLFHESFKEMPS